MFFSGVQFPAYPLFFFSHSQKVRLEIRERPRRGALEIPGLHAGSDHDDLRHGGTSIRARSVDGEREALPSGRLSPQYGKSPFLYG